MKKRSYSNNRNFSPKARRVHPRNGTMVMRGGIRF